MISKDSPHILIVQVSDWITGATTTHTYNLGYQSLLAHELEAIQEAAKEKAGINKYHVYVYVEGEKQEPISFNHLLELVMEDV